MHSLFVLSGGPGPEHEVSLRSGENVYNSAKKILNSEVYKIIISPIGEWLTDKDQITEMQGLDHIKEKNGIVFSVIHGLYGEDGTLAKVLEQANIPFIASGSTSLELTIDKKATGELLESHHIQVPRTFIITDVGQLDSISFIFPVIVKPRNEGSSISLYKVYEQSELKSILTKELHIRSEILLQEYIQGREFSSGVVEMNGILTPLCPTEIILTKGKLFDYTAKYSADGCKEVTPSEISEETQIEIQSLAQKVHTICGCKDISRTDVILHPTRGFFVLEINTLPGMTDTSFIPAQLRASGYSLEEFIGGMIQKYNR